LVACAFSELDFEEKLVPADDPAMRAELLLLSSSILVPCLDHDGTSVWDTLAIGEYLNDVRRAARLLPANLEKRTRCRSICGEMHSGFTALRSSLPMNLKGYFPGFKVWSRAQADIDRISAIWKQLPFGLQRAVPVRRTVDGRCDVCPGRHTLSHLRRRAR
jgi:glutathione S-transferase